MKFNHATLITLAALASFSSLASIDPSKLGWDGKIVRRDGSALIKNPMVFVEGKWRDLDSASHMEGICKLFGYKYAYAISYEGSGCFARKQVLINKKGKAERLKNAGCTYWYSDGEYYGSQQYHPQNIRQVSKVSCGNTKLID